MKAGDTVVSKRTGVQATVEQISYSNIFLQFVGNVSGKRTGSWVDKSAFRYITHYEKRRQVPHEADATRLSAGVLVV